MGPALERPVAGQREQARPVAALSALLDELTDVILAIPAETYTARPLPTVSGTIGAHVRHTLDHIAAFVAADRGILSYDRRDRGTAVEGDRSAALRQILRLKGALERWTDRSLNEPIRVRSLVSSGGAEVSGWSTLGRELAFVVSHTIHHQALIAVLLASQGEGVPGRFGVAPSTPQV